MNVRIFSPVVLRSMATTAILAAPSFFSPNDLQAQTGAGYYTDPATGIVYQQVRRTVDKPVMQTKVESRQQTVYRPQTVTETKPQKRTVFTPVVEYKWEPRVHNRWNPFRSPTVAYHHVPHAHWEQRNDVVQRTTTRTEWIAETRQVDMPTRVVRLQRQEEVDYEPVGRVSPQGGNPPSPNAALAARLRPLSPNQTITPSNALPTSTFSAPRIASSTLSRTPTDPSRTQDQTGMRTTTLSPSLQTLPQPTTGVANTMPLPMFR